MIQVGTSEIDITPDRSVDLCGFTLRNGPSTEIYDPLKMRWLSFRDNYQNRVLIGSADLISFSRNSYSELRKQVLSEVEADVCTGIALSTTHTHSGPATVTLRHCGRMDKAYLAAMKSRVVSSGKAALSAVGTDCEVWVGSAFCDLNINRRNGKNGPVDRELVVVGFKDPATGELVASLVNYACHPVVLGYFSNGVSADYPGYLTAFLENETGAPSLFLNGACGDVNPRQDKSSDPEVARKMGERLGGTAIEALQNGNRIDINRIEYVRQQITLPVRQPESPQDFSDRLSMLEKIFGISPQLFADRVARDVLQLENSTYPKQINLELALLKLGDELAILFVPGELFSSIGLKFKKMAAPRKLIISGFSNGSVGYLPDRQAYLEGGYEPNFANFFYDFPELDPSVEDVLLAGFERLLKKAGFAEAI